MELGSQIYAANGKFNGKPSTVLAIYQAPGANALAVAAGVQTRLAQLAQAFPDDVEYAIPFDTTKFVEKSLQDVISTLILTFTLVVAVVFFFLANWRATIVPTVAIPVSLIGTFAVLLAAGMSLNTISLFALVLAIGIVVDDAIVVVENVERIIAEEGLPPKEATAKAMQQITGPVIATTLVLLAVFVPTIFMPGITGRLYSQFAVTISVAVVISSINALTLSPALCGLVLRPRTGGPTGILAKFDAAIDGVRQRYVGIVGRLIKRPFSGVAAVAVIIGVIVLLSGRLPAGFLPLEDQGYLMVDVQLPDGAALGRTQDVTAEMEEQLNEIEGLEHVVTVNGYSILNSGLISSGAMVIVTLKPWEERQEDHLSADGILRQLWARFSTIASANVHRVQSAADPGSRYHGRRRDEGPADRRRNAAGPGFGRRLARLFGQPGSVHRPGLLDVPGQRAPGFRRS